MSDWFNVARNTLAVLGGIQVVVLVALVVWVSATDRAGRR